jgi:PilZ domain
MVSVSAVENRRQARRFRTHHPAQILLGPEAMISCMVKDISTGGARIAVKRQADLPESFELYIAAHDLQVRRARVCWRHGDFVGVSFNAEETAAASAMPAPGALRFEDCLDRAAMPAHLAAVPARKDLQLYRTAF